MTAAILRVLIVDDHALFRESIGRLLAQEPGIVIAGVCGTLAETRSLLRNTPVDLVLLDYDLGEELGTELLESLGHSHPPVPALIVTGGLSPVVTRRAVQAGAAGILLKHSSPQQLVEAIRQVAAGGTWWDPSVLPALASPVRESAAFTDRQTDILSLLLDGYSNKELASHLQVSESAIKASLQELFRKTGVRTRSQLVRIAIETGVGTHPTTARTK